MPLGPDELLLLLNMVRQEEVKWTLKIFRLIATT